MGLPTFSLRGDGMKARTLRGTAFTVLVFGSQNALRLASNLILTRLLFPEAFGLMAIVFVVLMAVNNLSDLGIKVSIIQDKDGDKPLFLDTAWSLQIIRGVLISLLIWAAAGPIAIFYEQPSLAAILPIAGLAAIIQGFNSTKLAIAEREVQLGRMAFLEILTQVIGLIATITLAVLMKSIWALVIGYLVGAVAMATLSHLMLSGHQNRLAFHVIYVRRMFNFGTYIFLASVAGFVISQGDRAILGKVTTLEELALYNIGYFLASVPMMMSQALSGKVVFPLYARRPPWESTENRRNIFNMRRLIMSGSLVGLFIFALIGEPLVVFMYDVRYEGAGGYVALIALALIPGLITSNYMSLALAAGDSKRFAIMAVGAAIIQTTAMLLGGNWFGVTGVVLGLALGPVLYYAPLVWFIRPYKGWDPLQDAAFALVSGAFVIFAMSHGTLDTFLQ